MGVGLVLIARATDEHAIAIRNVRSGTAILRQQDRLTILEIKSRGSFQRIALSHPSDCQQGEPFAKTEPHGERGLRA